MPVPRSMPANRAETATSCRKSSRCISRMPGWYWTSATSLSVTDVPDGERIGVSRMRSSRSRVSAAERTRMPTVRSPWSRYEEALPNRLVCRVLPMSAGVSPTRAAASGRTANRIDGPATTRPGSTSTTPGIFSMVSAISVAFFLSTAVSVEKILISQGLGDQVKSPIRSLSTPGNSVCRAGSASWIFSRSSSITVFRRSFAIRPQFHQEVAGIRLGDGQGQAGAGPPREALHLRRVEQDLLDVPQHAIGLGEAGARPGIVVQHEGPFFQLGQEVGFQPIVEQDACHDDQRHAGQGQPRVTQRQAHHPLVDGE